MASEDEIREMLKELQLGITYPLPDAKAIDTSIPHAPRRTGSLSAKDQTLAVSNALRYIQKEHHDSIAQELVNELKEYNHIYFYRLRPNFAMKAYPIHLYPGKCIQAKAIMHMIMNNLDPAVAQFPHELVTYGGNGSVFQNWAQFRIVMKYLTEMDEKQTLALYSGHPLGLFPSSSSAPRVVITNGMVVPNYSSKSDLDRMNAVGVSQYGQMTAGSFCYIGPQGIVHGTTLTILNAGRKYLGSTDLAGKVYLSSGLGGMSGAQGKAAVICGAVCVIAEVDKTALMKRYEQGWVMEKVEDVDACITRIRQARADKKPLSIAFLGNVVDLWEKIASIDEKLVDLASDQTSCHNPFNGGYYPAGLTFEESNKMMTEDPEQFKEKVQESLRRQIAAINKLTDSQNLKFWDYGNSFLLEASRAKADVMAEDGDSFKYPSYVQHIMGDIFSLGFGPFRWVCTSGKSEDLRKSDQIAADVTKKLGAVATADCKLQFDDNYLWITKAEEHKMVVGSKARILYSDAAGRAAIATAFNDAIASGHITAPIVISRDHHDVSGTDSPFRETSNITDGSMYCADMAVHNFVGDSFRGATYVALHNGGGTGWGEAINGGFGLVLDGTEEAKARAQAMLFWDVNNGVARRAWAKNDNALNTIKRAMQLEPRLQVTIPEKADTNLIDKLLQK